MSLSLLLGEEETGGFNYVFCAYGIPLEVGGVAFCSHTDVLTVHDELALFYVARDLALELTVHRVVLEHVCEVVDRAEVVDTHNLDVVTIFDGSAENETADTTETVDTYFDHNN